MGEEREPLDTIEDKLAKEADRIRFENIKLSEEILHLREETAKLIDERSFIRRNRRVITVTAIGAVLIAFAQIATLVYNIWTYQSIEKRVLDQSISTLERERAYLERQIAADDKKHNELNQLISNKEQELRTFETELNNLRTSREQELRTFKDELKDLRYQLNDPQFTAKKAELDTLLKAIDEARRELKRIQDSMADELAQHFFASYVCDHPGFGLGDIAYINDDNGGREVKQGDSIEVLGHTGVIAEIGSDMLVVDFNGSKAIEHIVPLSAEHEASLAAHGLRVQGPPCGPEPDPVNPLGAAERIYNAK